jgi:hypothetical protein
MFKSEVFGKPLPRTKPQPHPPGTVKQTLNERSTNPDNGAINRTGGGKSVSDAEPLICGRMDESTLINDDRNFNPIEPIIEVGVDRTYHSLEAPPASVKQY